MQKWNEQLYEQCVHTMSPIFQNKLLNTEMCAGVYFIGQTTFNPHTLEKFYWVKIGKTTAAVQRFNSYLTTNPCIFFIDWFPVEKTGKRKFLDRDKTRLAEVEKKYHEILNVICICRHRKEWFQISEKTYLKMCEKGFSHFPLNESEVNLD